MFYRLGQLASHHRIAVITIWAVLFLVSVPFIPQLPSVLKVGGFSNPSTESSQARAMLEETLPSFSPSTLVIIYQSEELTAQDPAFQRQAERSVADVVSLPEVSGITSFQMNPTQISDDGHTAYSLIQLTLPSQEAQRILPEINDRLVSTELETTVAGGPAFFEDIERLSEQDLRRAEIIAIPFAIIALVLVFGTIVGAAVPLFVGGLSVATVLGLMYLTAQEVDLSIFVLNLATMLGLGLAIDYSLFMTNRFREELEHRDVQQAAIVTTGTAGRAVFFSGITVLIGLAGLVLFDFMFLRSVGVAGILVVSVSVAGALTLLPAVLSLVGHRVNRLRVIHRSDDNQGTFWLRLSNAVMRHPWRIFVPVIIFLLVLGTPFLSVNLSSPDATILPRRVESRQGFEILKREFGPGAVSPVIIALESNGPVNTPENIAALYEFTHHLAADERVMRIESIVTLDPRISLEQYQLLYTNISSVADPFIAQSYQQLASEHTTAIFIYPRSLSTSSETHDLVQDIRDHQIGGGFRMLVDGAAAEIVDAVDIMYDSFPRVAFIVVLATFLILMLQFRSVVLPLKAVVMNALSIVASYGAVVFIFQQGHLSWLLGFEPMGYVEASLPIIMFCLLFGLSMDYEVFLLSRVRESYLESGDNQQSIATGLQRSGRIITGAALIVVVVTLSFVTAEIVLIKTLGVGIAIAVFIDATIVRALLVPATMRLLGDLNWWLPDRIRRALPDKEFAH